MSQINFKASYGTFDQHMFPVEVTNVTNKIMEDFFSNGKIIIPAKTDFNQLFGIPTGDQRKFLQVQTEDRDYNILEDNYQLPIEIELNTTRKLLKMVYYAYINRESNWEAIVSGQLLQLKGYGLLDEVELYVHITDTTSTFDDAIHIVKSICEKAIISLSNENQFEYPALKLVYDLSKHHPDSIFIYLHTKGMSYNVQSRLPIDIALLKGTFANWRRHLQSFANLKINKLGLFPSFENPGLKNYFGIGEGWIRYNFWYARGNYISEFCQEPLIQSFRYYWEIWLAGSVDKKKSFDRDCYNLYFEQNQRYFNVTDAGIRLDYLIRHLNQNET